MFSYSLTFFFILYSVWDYVIPDIWYVFKQFNQKHVSSGQVIMNPGRLPDYSNMFLFLCSCSLSLSLCYTLFLFSAVRFKVTLIVNNNEVKQAPYTLCSTSAQKIKNKNSQLRIWH